MPPAAVPVGLDLKQRLAALRRRLRFVATFKGGAWLAAVVLSVMLVAGALDWWLHLPALVRGVRLAGLCALFSALPVLVLLLLAPVTTATAFARLALPFSDVDWPRKTKIELDTPATRIGRNREYRVKGVVTGVIPKEATLEL